MVIDTSAILAILYNEPERRHFIELIISYSNRYVSAGSYLETAIVVGSRFGNPGVQRLKLYISSASIEVVEVTREQADIAIEAYFKFGKGRHRAALNYGDCFSYSLAILKNEPLLFKGDDFRHTDVVPVTAG